MKKLILLSAMLFALVGCEQKQTPPPAPAAPDAGTQPGGSATPGSDAAKDKK